MYCGRRSSCHPGVIVRDVEFYVANSGSTNVTAELWQYAPGQGLIFSMGAVAIAPGHGITATRAAIGATSAGPFPMGSRLLAGLNTPTDATVQINGARIGFSSGAGATAVLPAPIRAYDSRVSGGKLAAGSTRTVTLPASAIPPGLRPALINLVATAGTTTGGYLKVYAANASEPTASAINFGHGLDRKRASPSACQRPSDQGVHQQGGGRRHRRHRLRELNPPMSLGPGRPLPASLDRDADRSRRHAARALSRRPGPSGRVRACTDRDRRRDRLASARSGPRTSAHWWSDCRRCCPVSPATRRPSPAPTICDDDASAPCRAATRTWAVSDASLTLSRLDTYVSRWATDNHLTRPGRTAYRLSCNSAVDETTGLSTPRIICLAPMSTSWERRSVYVLAELTRKTTATGGEVSDPLRQLGSARIVNVSVRAVAYPREDG